MSELHSQCLILSNIELGDSLSKIQRKTKLSFVTVQKTVKVIEKKKIIKMKESVIDRGRAKKCVKISENHKKAAIFYMGVVDKMNHLLLGHNDINPMLFEIGVLDECLSNIRGEFSKDTLNIFNEWIKSSDGQVNLDDEKGNHDFYDIKGGKANFFLNDFEIKVKAIKKEEESTEKVTLDRFV